MFNDLPGHLIVLLKRSLKGEGEGKNNFAPDLDPSTPFPVYLCIYTPREIFSKNPRFCLTKLTEP